MKGIFVTNNFHTCK